MVNLYTDQQQLIADTRSALRDSRSVLMCAATGFGKTYCVSSMFQSAVNKGKRALMVMPRQELLSQTSNSFNNFGIDHGYISAKYDYESGKPAYLATTISLANRIDSIPDFDFLAIDETHHGDTALNKIIEHFKQRGTYIIGMSATPQKMSGRGMGCWYDKMVCGPDVKWLIQNKRLSEYRMFAPDRPDLSQIKMTRGDYNQEQLAKKMEGNAVIIGNQVTHYKNNCMGKINLTFGAGRKHAEILNQAYKDAGIPSAYVDGDTPYLERKRIFRALGKRELLNVCNCDLLTYGFDLSLAADMDVTVESISIGRPTKSIALWRQILGRALRYKNYPAIIFDHTGSCFDLGLPDTPIEWSLDDVPKQKKAESVDGVRICKRCLAAYEITAACCPYCGAIREPTPREIKQREGELQEIRELEIKRTLRIEVGRAQTLQDLEAIARARGYKSQWVRIRAKLKGII